VILTQHGQTRGNKEKCSASVRKLRRANFLLRAIHAGTFHCSIFPLLIHAAYTPEFSEPRKTRHRPCRTRRQIIPSVVTTQDSHSPGRETTRLFRDSSAGNRQMWARRAVGHAAAIILVNSLLSTTRA